MRSASARARPVLRLREEEISGRAKPLVEFIIGRSPDVDRAVQGIDHLANLLRAPTPIAVETAAGALTLTVHRAAVRGCHGHRHRGGALAHRGATSGERW